MWSAVVLLIRRLRATTRNVLRYLLLRADDEPFAESLPLGGGGYDGIRSTFLEQHRGLPPHAAELIIHVNRILERQRTTCNRSITRPTKA